MRNNIATVMTLTIQFERIDEPAASKMPVVKIVALKVSMDEPLWDVANLDPSPDPEFPHEIEGELAD